MATEKQLVEQLNDVGNRVLDPPCSTPELIELLDEVRAILSKVGQKPSDPVKEALLPSMKGLITDELFRNSDPDIKITLAACLNEIMRISAPVAPYDDGRMKDIFELTVSSFDNLSTLHGRCYSKAVVILENMARLRSFVMMLDLDCDPLITKMFELFLKNISSDHPRSVLLAMETIMSVLIKESDAVSEELLEVLLASIRNENQDISLASRKLGAKVIEECSEKLKPYITKTMGLTGSSMEDCGPVHSEVCKNEHDTVKNLDDDSSKDVVNSKPSSDESNSAEFVQVLKEKERRIKKVVSETDNKTTGDLRTKSGSNTSKKAKKRSTHNPNEANGNILGKVKTTNDVKGKQLNNGVSGNKENSAGASRKDKSQMRDASRSKSQKKRVYLSDDDEADADNNDYDDDGPIETPYGKKSYKEDLVGARIKVWWPLDRRFYEGIISAYYASARKHNVDYDDGDEETLNLKEEKWEFIGDELAADIVSDITCFINIYFPRLSKNPDHRDILNKDLMLEKKKTQPDADRPQRESSEEEASETHSGKRGTPESGPKNGDGNHDVSRTMEKSKRPGVSGETKRPRLSDGQKS